MNAILRTLLLAPLAVTVACQSMPDQREVESPWAEAFVAPTEITTSRMRLVPLEPSLNALDFLAAQNSLEHLQTTLQWGGWPSRDATQADNEGDLQNHWNEFESKEAYAYSVLAPAGAPCIGCVYLNPDQDDPRSLRMAYWVVESELENDLDVHVVDTVLDMIADTWPVDVVTIGHPEQNPRGIKILEQRGLARASDDPNVHVFQWKR
tara:strand:+ start:3736 stop:4359 length:624 start_codon:yes stop_codon:yes gene_type:complete